jgi:hypothetical protein
MLLFLLSSLSKTINKKPFTEFESFSKIEHNCRSTKLISKSISPMIKKNAKRFFKKIGIKNIRKGSLGHIFSAHNKIRITKDES